MNANQTIDDVFAHLDPKDGELTDEQIASDMQRQAEEEKARQMTEYTTNYIVGVDDVADD